jgi:CDP-diacylglycerol pyrophosphatase
MEPNIYFVSEHFYRLIHDHINFFVCLNSNLLKGQDHLHIHVYDEDIVGKDSIGSAKISLKKVQQAGGHLDEWVKLPAHLGLGSHGEVHLILKLS